MDEAGATRRAALDSVSDVEPDGLYDRIECWLEEGSMVPGVLTLQCAYTLGDQSVERMETEPNDALAERAAGVQLIYDGLRLTRVLAHDEPWADGDTDAADLDILVADVLVARGFYLLARTGAAKKAVETVRQFGRDQTIGRETDDQSVDRNLEVDTLELAMVAGADFAGTEVPARLHEFVTERAAKTPEIGSTFPPVDRFFVDGGAEWLQGFRTGSGGEDGLTTSVDD